MEYRQPKSLDETIKFYEKLKAKDEVNLKCCEKNPEKCAEYITIYKENIEFDDRMVTWLTQLKEIQEAYESDYQVQDVIEKCVEFWG